ncbi:MAG: nuclear transport factor 2 family protein [Donghicola eburneus]|nr:nuclear transport factor 2 family protein [Donghicola eburneus]MBY8964297.1 nuclear transport factor 2 family protein [Algiphilus acroporae]MCI5041139.1 nuclear transport factor 2 family protein [Donghicola eburneus]
MTQQDAAEAFAKAWNTLRPDGLVAMLSANARFTSQRVFEELEGRDAIAAYLTKKMNTMLQSTNTVFAELSESTTSFAGRPCVAIAQGTKDTLVSAALFEVEGGLITRIDMCLPETLKPLRTETYPTW